MIKHLCTCAMLTLILTSCAGQVAEKVQPVVQSVSQDFLKDLAALNNVAGPDLDVALAEASAIVPSTGKPYSAPLAQCLTAGKTVKDMILK